MSVKEKEDLILCGDFNIPRGTSLFNKLTQEFTSWVPDSYKSSLDPLLFRNPSVQLVVDHLFTRGRFMAADIWLESGLSDHQAIIAEMYRVDAVDEKQIANY